MCTELCDRWREGRVQRGCIGVFVEFGFVVFGAKGS